jgi:hypothetical protein
MTVTSSRYGARYAVPVAAVFALSTCAIEPRRPDVRPTTSSAALSGAQISASLGTTALEAIQRLHPLALNIGGARSRQPIVYLDEVRLGGVGELQGIQAASLYEIRFLNSVEAAARFGPSHSSGGAIVLTSKNWRGTARQ